MAHVHVRACSKEKIIIFFLKNYVVLFSDGLYGDSSTLKQNSSSFDIGKLSVM